MCGSTACNSSTEEAEAEGSRILGQPRLSTELHSSVFLLILEVKMEKAIKK
jgi:hypothetical protein